MKTKKLTIAIAIMAMTFIGTSCGNKQQKSASEATTEQSASSALEIDSLLSAGELEQLLTDTNNLGLPKILVSERPDNAVNALLQGRVIVIVNGSPYALIMPAVLIDFLSSPEDTNLKTIFANFLKVIRIIAAFFALLLPGLYIAITNFHREIIPTELLLSLIHI